jgi:hypothetical protein
MRRPRFLSAIQTRSPTLALLATAWLWCLPSLANAQNPSKTPLPKISIAADGRTFATADGKPFVPMGINYYRPGTGWSPQVWKKFDRTAVQQDFARMKAQGVNCVRVFLSYGSFFWDANDLLPEGLSKFDQLLALAEDNGIYIHPTGPDHWEGLPKWARADRIADERALAAVETFWRKFAARYRGRSVIFAYDLLNEPSVPLETKAVVAKWNVWLQSQYGSAAKTAQAWGVAPEKIHWGQQVPPPLSDAPGSRQLLDFQHFREGLADDWTRRQAAAIKSVDPQALVTVGFLPSSVPTQLGGVRDYTAFRPERQAKFLDFLEVHFYPLKPWMLEYTAKDEQRNLAHMESLVREMAKPGKPVVVAEFGWYGGGTIKVNGHTFGVMSEEQQAQWCRGLIQTSRGLATGWLNWGLYDQPEARDLSQRTGLFTADGRPKVWASDFRKLADSLAGKAILPARLGPRPTLDWESCLMNSAAGRQFDEEYYKAFRNEKAVGANPIWCGICAF